MKKRILSLLLVLLMVVTLVPTAVLAEDENVEYIEITEPGVYSFDGTNDIYRYHIYTKEPKCAHITVKGEVSILCETSTWCVKYIGNNEAYVDLSGGTRSVSIVVNASGAGELIVSFDEHDLEIANTIDPTCEERGSTSYVCKNCSGEITEWFEPIGHAFNGDLCTRCGKYTCQSKIEPEKHIYDKDGVCIRCGEALPEPLKLENEAVYSLSADGVFTVYEPNAAWDNANAVYEYFRGHIQNVQKIVYKNGTKDAFMYCATNTEEVYLGSTVQDFDSMGCDSLAKIDVSEDNPNFSVEDDVLYNKDKTVLVRYPAPKNGASFDIPDTVVKIDSEAFDGSKLESIHIPDSVTEIKIEAFRRCEKLETIKLPNKLTTIYRFTFDYCTNLKTVVIPSSVKRIEFGAFPLCYKLADIYYTGTEEQWNAIEFCNGLGEQVNAIEFNNMGAEGWGIEIPSSPTIHFNNHQHVTELRNAEPATCTDPGYTGDEVCTVCGETISQGEVIEATSHHFKGSTCTDCGATRSTADTIRAFFQDSFNSFKSFFDKLFGR